MSKRAEERGLEALPPRWRKTKDGKGRVDSALPVRKFYIRAYEQAEKDLILTWQDIKAIVEIADSLLTEDPNDHPGWIETAESYYKAVLEEYLKTKEKWLTKKN